MGEGVFLPQDLAQAVVNYIQAGSIPKVSYVEVSQLLQALHQASMPAPTEEPSGGDPSTEERD